VALHQGNLPAARDRYQAALTMARTSGDAQTLIHIFINLAFVFSLEGKLEQSETHLHRDLGLAREIASKSLIAYALCFLGAIATQQGRYEQAEAYLRESEHTDRTALCFSLRDHSPVPNALFLSSGTVGHVWRAPVPDNHSYPADQRTTVTRQRPPPQECLPMAKLYVVSLSDAERLLLHQTIKKGKAPARTTTRARILLKADTGLEGPEWADTKIAEAVEVSRATVERLRKRAVTEGVDAALQDRPKWENRHGKLDGEHEARLTALACSTPPAGQKRWTLHLLASYFGDREGVPVSYELVRRVLKKTGCRPIARSSGASRPRRTPRSAGTWRMCSMSTPVPMIRNARRSASTSVQHNFWPMSAIRCPLVPEHRNSPVPQFGRTTSMSARARSISSCGMSPYRAAGMWR
jgi:transposase